MHAHIHARIYNIINREEAGRTTTREGGPYFTEKFDKSARVLRFLQPYPLHVPATASSRVYVYTHGLYARIYIYGAAVINLRSKITYGPQMLRSVFLRFPLFIHPPLVPAVECREKTHARRLYAPILYTHTAGGRAVHVLRGIYTYSGGGGRLAAGKPTIFLPGKKRRRRRRRRI